MDADTIRTALRKFVCSEILHNPEYPLKDDEPLITGGLIDSFSLAQIGVFSEIEFKAYIPDAELTVDRMNTIDQMVSKIMEKIG